jgi:hypothetical protein
LVDKLVDLSKPFAEQQGIDLQVRLDEGSNQTDLGVGVLVLPASTLGAFEQCVFLTGPDIDEYDELDDWALTSF